MRLRGTFFSGIQYGILLRKSVGPFLKLFDSEGGILTAKGCLPVRHAKARKAYRVKKKRSDHVSHQAVEPIRVQQAYHQDLMGAFSKWPFSGKTQRKPTYSGDNHFENRELQSASCNSTGNELAEPRTKTHGGLQQELQVKIPQTMEELQDSPS